MSLLVILLLIATETTTSLRQNLRAFCSEYILKMVKKCDDHPSLNSNLKILTLTLIPTAIVALCLLLFATMAKHSDGVFWFISSGIYLLITLAILYCAINNGTLIAATSNIIKSLIQRNYSYQTSDLVKSDELNADPTNIIKTNFNFFAVIFWYLCLNPIVSLLYCLLDVVANNTSDIKTRDTANKWLHILDWIPARALGITLVFMGDFNRSFKAFTNHLLDFDTPYYEVIANISNHNQDNLAAANNLWQLHIRSVVLWVLVLAAYLYINY